MKEIDNFYNTYNARHLKPSEVAESFIFSNSFEKLIQNDHSVILGARGCGKTTLMKMLTLPALYHWEHERAADIRMGLPFHAVYISTDIYWDVKNQTYSSELESFGNFSERISQFSVTSNVFSSLCDTFKNIVEIDICCDNEAKELELCKVLIKAWRLNATVPKIEYVKEALNERVDFVNQFIQDVIFNHKIKRLLRLIFSICRSKLR
jgi:energy-coupling factor transporter ATP-binding protein EcfA2